MSGNSHAKRSHRVVPWASMAFVLLLIAFVSLGTLVVTLATGSALAPLIGVVFAVALIGAIIEFRLAANQLSHSVTHHQGMSGSSLFDWPMDRDDVDRYLRFYRGTGTR